jgi:hypothetical protein
MTPSPADAEAGERTAGSGPAVVTPTRPDREAHRGRRATASTTYVLRPGDRVTERDRFSQTGARVREREIQSPNGTIRYQWVMPGTTTTQTLWRARGSLFIAVGTYPDHGVASWKRTSLTRTKPYSRITSNEYPGGDEGPLFIEFTADGKPVSTGLNTLQEIADGLGRLVRTDLSGVLYEARPQGSIPVAVPTPAINAARSP